MTAPDPLDAADEQPQPTPDAVLDWIADRINARPWPIDGGYPVRMQDIDDGTAELHLLPAGFDPEEDWEDPPPPVARYRITLSPWEPPSAEGADVDTAEDGTYWCTPCGRRIGRESHYHCGRCGEVSSMLGHSRPDGTFACQTEKVDRDR